MSMQSHSAEESKSAKNAAFWRHYRSWEPLLDESRPLRWLEQWLENDYCRDCRYCCGPQGTDEPFPMALLPNQISPDNQNDFYMLNHNTAYIGEQGCKSRASHGCRLGRVEKPVACGLFPIVLANGGLYLYQNCPAVFALPLAVFMRAAQQAARMLDQFSLEELRHISIDLPCEILTGKYIDLHLQLFDASGKITGPC